MSIKRTSRHKKLGQMAMVAAAASVLAACSSDVERLSDYPPVNTTASVPQAQTTARSAPVERVAARPLPGASASATPSWSRPSYTPPARTAYTPPRQSTATRRTAGTLVVRPGQTLYSIARANGLSVREVAAANGLSSYQVKVGQRLRIPGVSNPVSPAPTVGVASHGAPAAVQPTPARAVAEKRNYSAARPRVHRVAPGETLFSLGRRYGVNPYRIAAYNGLPRNVQLKVGQSVRIPAASGWSMSASQASGAARKASRKVAEAPVHKPAPKDDARIEQAQAPAPRRQKVAESAPQEQIAAGFRWPVRGRVISSFGEKPGGVRNEGINIAVPEGADIHAAADGVVAYAGNELKGYGNLVLIRHKDGWVTAYAHNKALFVKRGDRVRAGQVIAKAGSTGSVKTSQLHFELRKGATAVNPLKYLNTRTAMN